MPPNLSSSPALTHSSESSSHALHDLAHFTPAQKQRLIEQMERDGKFQQLLSRVASISGAGWKGWEKGVNGALSSIGDGFTATGKLIGESAAIAVHGKEWEFLAHSVQKTQWIRDAGNVIGEVGKIVGEKLVDSPTGLVHDTGKYWHGVYVEGKKQSASMTAEQIAFSTGNIAGNIAVGAVTGYALKWVQTVRVVGSEAGSAARTMTEIGNTLAKTRSLGSSTLGKWLDTTLSKIGQLSVETLGGGSLAKGHEKDLAMLAHTAQDSAQFTKLWMEWTKVKWDLRDMIFVAKKEGKSPEIIAEITRLTTQRNLLAPQVTEMKNILEIAGHTLNETTGDIAIQALKKTGTKRILTAGASQEVQVESKKQEKILRNAALDTTARLTMVENILREQGFLDPKNLEKLKKLGLVDDRGALSKKAKDQILAGHSVGKPVLEQDFWSIRTKARASQDIPKEWKKLLMDEGLMGPLPTHLQAKDLAGLKKLNPMMANQLEAFSQSTRTLQFPTGTNWPDWAKSITTGTIEPLDKMVGVASSELLSASRTQIYGNAAKNLADTIIFRLNGKTAWIETIWVKQGLEDLSRKGFHLSADLFAKAPSAIKEAMTQLIARVEVSGAALVSKSRVGEVRSDIARDRDTWKKALQSPSLTREQLKDIEYGYTQKIANTEQKIKDLKDIESRLALLTGKSPREVDALREIKWAIFDLSGELGTLRLSVNGVDISAARKRLQSLK